MIEQQYNIYKLISGKQIAEDIFSAAEEAAVKAAAATAGYFAKSIEKIYYFKTGADSYFIVCFYDSIRLKIIFTGQVLIEHSLCSSNDLNYILRHENNLGI